MTDFKPERLIPLIRVTRKFTACDTQQKLKVLQQLPSVFNAHQSMSLLSDIIVSGLFDRNIYEKISEDLYAAIATIFPSDDELHLTDSVYESQLKETPEDPNAEEPTNQKTKKLPLTLLRIPTDLQYRFLHCLDYKDLITAQKVCRAVFFVA